VKRLLLVLSVTLVVTLLSFVITGCQAQPKEVDPAVLNLVDHYVEELTAALLDAEPDLLGWIREPYADDIPLKYSEERIGWLLEHRTRIEEIRQLRASDLFPAEADIALWQVIVVRGDDEWLLEGPAVIGALSELETLSDRVIDAIEMIKDGNGELSLTESQGIIKLTEEINPAVEEIRAVFYK
jgi:hypothetical protein